MIDNNTAARLLQEADEVLTRAGALDQARAVRELLSELATARRAKDEWRDTVLDYEEQLVVVRRQLAERTELLRELRDYTAELERRYMPFVATRGYAEMPESSDLRERLRAVLDAEPTT